ncbi:MAG: hypothetical protein JW819_06865 [Candidatus Krumholzibacteriota bacterium]|nr:hypothetical protein [Candidatus Krumholzibacteriota bacterium]
MRPIRCCLAVLFLVGAAGAAAGETVVVDGISHVRNGAAPSEGVVVYDLEELWRAGDEDDEIFFGLVTRVASAANGDVYLFDPRQHCVQVYGPDGQHRRTLFREGEGPGELSRLPRDMCLVGEDEVGVAQFGPRSIERVRRDGTPSAVTQLAHPEVARLSPVSAAWAAGRFLVAGEEAVEGQIPGTGTRTTLLAAYDEAGEQAVRFLERRREFNYHAMVFREAEHFQEFAWSFAVDAGGRVFALPDRERYAIHVFAPDGSLERVIERDFAPRRRTDAERARARRLAERRFRTAPFDVDYHIEETAAVVAWFHRGLQVAPNGELWVRHARSAVDQPSGVVLAFDVFDAGGNFVRQAVLAGEGDGEGDGFFLAGADRMIRVVGFVDAMRDHYGGGRGSIGEGGDIEEPDPLDVICYRLRRR